MVATTTADPGEWGGFPAAVGRRLGVLGSFASPRMTTITKTKTNTKIKDDGQECVCPT
jgi:hypothetical protein